MTDTVRVATVNIWCRHGDWTARREVLRGGFRTLQPDLVALQETVVTDESNQTLELFGDEYHVLHQGRRTPDGVDCSISPAIMHSVPACVASMAWRGGNFAVKSLPLRDHTPSRRHTAPTPLVD
ncbi:hypothetical protein E0H75_28940 [Kribbella capetownensis]|uniref:Endonuclease/exonuclease/phosphatase domain-containing protein n=1 Tax=Kribbella capetownensis TaxID=1572659 RepID=A0A4V2M706_9ACTN|nr:endonuclease/exonuclease/phosphatase family protein [Kribbella capetownensis]TCC45752.1 hypothetical protein E0H75_28940 [Kribbella capetownensis]